MIGSRLPWTHMELEALKRSLDEKIRTAEEMYPNIRPLPPMTEEEAKDLILSMGATAVSRVLTEEESFLLAQLLAAYQMAVRAAALGYKGRCYVVNEDDIAGSVEESGKSGACSCPRTDAWRCARARGLKDVIACTCACHREGERNDG